MALPHALRPLRKRAAQPPQPFRSAEQAWFWTVGALAARHNGSNSNRRGTPRPCDPDDIVICLDALYRGQHVDLSHARILQRWGSRQTAPNPDHANECRDAALWREALDRLEAPLRAKGIVA